MHRPDAVGGQNVRRTVLLVLLGAPTASNGARQPLASPAPHVLGDTGAAQRAARGAVHSPDGPSATWTGPDTTLARMDLVDRLRTADGCLRRSRLVRTPAEGRELRALVDAGAIVRHGQGLYALPGVAQAVVAARRVGGSLTCVSAIAAAGLPLLDGRPQVHVCLPRGRGAPRAGLLPAATVLHWDATVPTTGGRLVAPTGLALTHAIGCLPLREVVAAADAALRTRLVADVADLARHRPRAARARFDRVLRLVDGRSESMPESFLRLGLRAAGLGVEPQVVVDGVGRVDLLVEGVLLVEVDGYAYHSDRRAFREDRRRDRAATLLGPRVLRFTYEDVVHDTARVVHEVLTVLAALDRRPACARQDVRRV